jgi:hypothetical protein
MSEEATIVDGPPVNAPPPEPPAEPAAPVDEDAALEAAIDEQAIDIPDGEKLVPLSALTSLRGKFKEYKAQLADASTKAGKTSELEARLAEAQRQIDAATPYVQAYQQLQQQQQPAEPKESAEDVAELKDIATELDLYTPTGDLDIERARRVQTRQMKMADRVVQQHIAPMQQQSVQQASVAMFRSALATKAPSGATVDPGILKEVWQRLDPSVTATKEGAIQAWNVALGYSVATGKGGVPAPAAPKAEVPDPLFSEKDGGRTASAAITMTDGDKRAAKDMGLTEAEYAKEVEKMPWRRR